MHISACYNQCSIRQGFILVFITHYLKHWHRIMLQMGENIYLIFMLNHLLFHYVSLFIFSNFPISFHSVYQSIKTSSYRIIKQFSYLSIFPYLSFVRLEKEIISRILRLTQKDPKTHTLTNWPMQTGLKQVTVCRRPPFIHSRVESESRGGRREDWLRRERLLQYGWTCDSIKVHCFQDRHWDLFDFPKSLSTDDSYTLTVVHDVFLFTD